MVNKFESVLFSFLGSEIKFSKEDDACKGINRAFLVLLSGKTNPDYDSAEEYLKGMAGDADWGEAAKFYLDGVNVVKEEIKSVAESDQDFSNRLSELAEQFPDDLSEAREKMWGVFFPEGLGILADKDQGIGKLREKRTISITKPNENPISDPGSEILFTSNALVTVPLNPESEELDKLPDDLKDKIREASKGDQCYWYDHPIPMDMKPENNEVLYGLKGLQETFKFERERGTTSSGKLTCVLSVSVTHDSLKSIAGDYLRNLVSTGGIEDMDLYAFTESDTEKLLNEVFLPAAEHFFGSKDVASLEQVLGVDGEYGKHYSFLKAISAIWKVFVKPEVRATFKIDLDQVFPQKELVEQTGKSAFEHYKSPLWGALGTDSEGSPVELGMIAGALVNEKDIHKSLFTPDVNFPDRDLALEENVFFSTLPQALSTQAEMMARYDGDALDGEKKCIHRIHVTGGTNGIMIDSLRKYRPFTPSFIGRAEDQCYILSVLLNPDRRLAYLHEDGLIMRHDKEAFAQEAMKAAKTGKTIGDYIRILYFSAYANLLAEEGGGSLDDIKDVIDPFTGCFVSKIPATIVFLRLALKLEAEGSEKDAAELLTQSAQRVNSANAYIRGKNSDLKKDYLAEKEGWTLFYDLLDVLESGLKINDPVALKLKEKAVEIIEGSKLI